VKHEHRNTLKAMLQLFSARIYAIAETHVDIGELLRQVERGLERAIENVPRKIL
jgi:trans-2-enoyl-CoA reductase